MLENLQRPPLQSRRRKTEVWITNFSKFCRRIVNINIKHGPSRSNHAADTKGAPARLLRPKHFIILTSSKHMICSTDSHKNAFKNIHPHPTKNNPPPKKNNNRQAYPVPCAGTGYLRDDYSQSTDKARNFLFKIVCRVINTTPTVI